MPTKCIYACNPAKPVCLSPPAAGDTSCACRSRITRPHLKPIADDADSDPNSDTPRQGVCSKKQISDIVGVEVNCEAIKIPFGPKQLLPIEPDIPMCKIQPHPQAGKLRDFLVALRGGSQMCRYECQMAGYTCTDGGDGSTEVCGCATTLAPRLVLKSMPSSSRFLIRQDADESCVVSGTSGEHSCGPCGTCELGVCVSKKNTLSGNYCPCGFVCPLEEDIVARTVGLGSPIYCVRNSGMAGLACGNGAKGTGLTVPDICMESDISDALDECVCHKSKREVLGKFTAGNAGNRCVPSKLA
jgi:hypothetical protein